MLHFPTGGWLLGYTDIYVMLSPEKSEGKNAPIDVEGDVI